LTGFQASLQFLAKDADVQRAEAGNVNLP